jgi:hypothetical protein
MTGQSYKVYSINFVAMGVNLAYFENFLRYDPAILGFWNYIPLVYLVKTNIGSANELATRVRNYLGGNHCLVAEINPYNVDGWLPKPAWDWFYSPPEKQLTSSGLGEAFATNPPQGGGLGGLFGWVPGLPRK